MLVFTFTKRIIYKVNFVIDMICFYHIKKLAYLMCMSNTWTYSTVHFYCIKKNTYHTHSHKIGTKNVDENIIHNVSWFKMCFTFVKPGVHFSMINVFILLIDQQRHPLKLKHGKLSDKRSQDKDSQFVVINEKQWCWVDLLHRSPNFYKKI